MSGYSKGYYHSAARTVQPSGTKFASPGKEQDENRQLTRQSFYLYMKLSYSLERERDKADWDEEMVCVIGVEKERYAVLGFEYMFPVGVKRLAKGEDTIGVKQLRGALSHLTSDIYWKGFFYSDTSVSWMRDRMEMILQSWSFVLDQDIGVCEGRAHAYGSMESVWKDLTADAVNWG